MRKWVGMLFQNKGVSYWSCPSLAIFWTLVFQSISVPVNRHIEPNPINPIFGIAPELDLPKAKLEVLAFISVLAWTAILLKWKTPAPPSYSHWIRHVMLCLNLEKSATLLKNQRINFTKYGVSEQTFRRGPFFSFFFLFQFSSPPPPKGQRSIIFGLVC